MEEKSFCEKAAQFIENKEKEIFSRRQGSVNKIRYILSFHWEVQINKNKFLLSIEKCKYI